MGSNASNDVQAHDDRLTIRTKSTGTGNGLLLVPMLWPLMVAPTLRAVPELLVMPVLVPAVLLLIQVAPVKVPAVEM